MSRIIAIATGQAVANLPTLLAIAQPDDEIIFLESAEIRSGNKNAGLDDVLRRRGLRVGQAIEIDDDADALAQQLSLHAQRWRDQPLSLALNGGTKLTALAVTQALAPLQPALYYGQDKPCGYLKLDIACSKLEKQPYPRAVTLDEVLACAGHQRFVQDGQPSGLRIYPAADNPLPEVRYGIDEAYTVAQHESYLANVTDCATATDLPTALDEPFPVFRVLVQTRPQAVLEWQNELLALLGQPQEVRSRKAIEAALTLAHADIPQRLIIQPEMVLACENLFGYLGRNSSPRQTLLDNLGPLESFYVHLRRLSVFPRPTASAPPALPVASKLGAQLEQGVAARVLRYLAANLAQAAIVAEVWLNPRTAKLEAPHIVTQEFDVLVLLKNGVMLHLECKTGKIEAKDLDARLLNIQKAGSSLAQMCVVTPLYTAYAAKPWFRDLHDISQRVKGFRSIGAITLTLPNQPAEYTYPNAQWEPETFKVESFEQGLSKLFKPYLA